MKAALYSRVSTSHQTVDMQVTELRAAARERGWESVEFTDEASGASRDRPGLAALMAAVQAGKINVVMIWKLDRLARSTQHLLEMTELFRERKVELISLRDAYIDTTSPTGRFTLQILGAVSELERSLIQERVKAGVERAKAKGIKLGRPKIEMAEEAMAAAQTLKDQGWGFRAIAKATGISRDTLRRRLKEKEDRASCQDTKD